MNTLKKIKEISIILVGSWNTKIFTPGWVTKELFELTQDEEFNVAFNNEMQLSYKYCDVILIPTDREVAIKIEKITKESIIIANKITLKLITTLPYTPNLLVGFNYKYTNDCEIKDINIQNYSDKFTLNEVKLFKKENNFTLNVIISCGNTKLIVYNFHYNKISLITDKCIDEHIKYLEQYGR